MFFAFSLLHEHFGFHTIHGRAPAIATGVKLANPELDVWVITGDGDGFSIGGNHMMHAIRRNVNLQILLFNNEIYGLTKDNILLLLKSALSPSSPSGSVDAPLSPCLVSLGSGGTFIARSIDTEAKHLSGIVKRAVSMMALRSSKFFRIARFIMMVFFPKSKIKSLHQSLG